MVMTKTQNGTALTLKLEGRLDALTSPQLEEELNSSLDGITDLKLDFEKVEYISSAGFRVLIIAYKLMHDKGSLKVINASSFVKEAFKLACVDSIISVS